MVVAVDIGIVLVVLLSLLAGMRSGFVQTLFSLGAWLGGIVIAVHLADPLLVELPTWVQEIPGAVYVVGVLIFLIAYTLISLVGLIGGSHRERASSPGDRGLGGLLGFARGIFLAAAIGSLLVAFLSPEGQIMRRSGSLRLLAPAGRLVSGLAPEWLRDRMEDGWDYLDDDETTPPARTVSAGAGAGIGTTERAANG